MDAVERPHKEGGHLIKTKQPDKIDLSEYAEEKVPFDDVIRRIASAKPVHKVTPKPKTSKRAVKRK